MGRARRWIALAAAAPIAAALLGAAYERSAESRDARRFPPPGRLVDVGGRALHLLCLGRGAPTVLFEASGFGNSTSFERARVELASRTRVCSYDRAGVGWSDPPPRGASVGTLADDLQRLIDRATIAPPFVIVTSSIGGLVTELFARRHPDAVAGLVFLDAATSDMVPMAEPRVRARSTRSACAAAVAAGRIGVVRALDPFRLRTQATDEASRSAALTYGAQPWAALCTLVETVDVTQGEFADAPPLPRDLRLAVLTALSIEGLVPPGLTVDAAALAPLKAELHRRFAARSDRGSWALVDSGHLIASQRPDVVVAAVREVIGR